MAEIILGPIHQVDARIKTNALIKLPRSVPEWKNTYAQNTLPNALSDFGEAIKKGFDRRIIAGFQAAGMPCQFKGA